jgi:hypothetical protein
VGEGKFRVTRAPGVKRVRYWHPDREFKWTPDAWQFVTRLSEQPIDSTDRGVSFSDSSPSSTSSGVATTAAAAAGIAAAGGAFDGGGASSSWDDARSGSDSETSTAAATSY